MFETFLYTALTAAVAGGVIVVFPLVRTGTMLLCLVLVRSITDVGAASGASVLPSSSISAAIAIAAIAAAVLPNRKKLPGRLTRFVALLACSIGVWGIIPLFAYGLDPDLLKEPLRLLSILGILILGYRYGAEIVNRRSVGVHLVIMVPAAILIGTFLLQIPQTLSQSRAAGTFSHPNSAAAFFAVAGVACFANWWFNRSKIALICVAAAVIATAMTGSLGGLVSVITGFLMVVLASTRLKAPQKIALIGILISVGVAAFNIFSGSGRLAEFESFDASSAVQSQTSSDSLEWRLINWNLLLGYWRLAPWFGHGLGTTYTYIMPLGGPPHSLFVQALVETGVVGTALFLTMGIFFVTFVVRKLKSHPFESSAILGLATVLVVNGSESNLLGYTAAMYALALYVGFYTARMSSDVALGANSNVTTNFSTLSSTGRNHNYAN